MKHTLAALIPFWGMGCVSAEPKPPMVTTLMSKSLPDFPDKEVEMLAVHYGPGGMDPVHRHNAHAFVYVLDGSVEMQVQGGKAVTLTPGQTFYEGPDDIHTVGRNVSGTRPARFLVFLIKNKNAPVLIPTEIHTN